MKIAKVNHIKTAVAVRNNKTEGILYEDPSKHASKDIEEHLTRLISSADRLYSVFNEVRERTPNCKEDEQKVLERKERDEKLREIKKAFQSAFSSSYIDNDLKAERLVKGLKNRLPDMTYELDKQILETAVNTILKKSLRREKVKEGLVSLMGRGFGISDIKEDPEAEAVCLAAIMEDRSKEKQKGNIVRAIKNQNLVIQPDMVQRPGVLGLSAGRQKGG